MSDYDPNTMVVESYEVIGVRCALCPPMFIVADREPTYMTMAELDTVCQRHWREVHEHTHVTPM